MVYSHIDVARENATSAQFAGFLHDVAGNLFSYQHWLLGPSLIRGSLSGQIAYSSACRVT